jgi:hypothetical protein
MPEYVKNSTNKEISVEKDFYYQISLNYSTQIVNLKTFRIIAQPP